MKKSRKSTNLSNNPKLKDKLHKFIFRSVLSLSELQSRDMTNFRNWEVAIYVFTNSDLKSKSCKLHSRRVSCNGLCCTISYLRLSYFTPNVFKMIYNIIGSCGNSELSRIIILKNSFDNFQNEVQRKFQIDKYNLLGR